MNSFFSKYRWLLIIIASGGAIALAIYFKPTASTDDAPVSPVAQESETEVDEPVDDVVEAEEVEETVEEVAAPEVVEGVEEPEAQSVETPEPVEVSVDEVQVVEDIVEPVVENAEPEIETTVEDAQEVAVEEPEVVEPVEPETKPEETVAEEVTSTATVAPAAESAETATTTESIAEEVVVDEVVTEDATEEPTPTAAPQPVDEASVSASAPVVEDVEQVLDVTTAEEAGEDGVKPAFDIVRVDSSGAAVIAGSAEPNSTVTITSNGEEIGEATSDSSGEFVAIIQVPENEQGQTLELESEIDGQLVFSDETILILPSLNSSAANTVDEETAPAIIRATEDEVVIVQGASQLALGQVSLDSISYDTDEEVVLAGRGNPGRTVIIYVDDKPLMDTVVSESGSWKQALHGLDAGRYTLRVDEIDVDGNVTSRVESPFQREYPEDVREAKLNPAPTYTVQPGNSLWVIATGRYGDGLKYHQIFAANQDQIRDPDLIYPGQVFALPKNEE